MTGKLIVACIALLLSGSWLIAADEGPSAAPPAAGASARKSKLVKPWSDLTLTDDQKAKIESIHAVALEAEKAARAKERTEIEALLSPEQKTQLQALEGKTGAARKERAAAAKKTVDGEAAGPTTAPSPQ